MDQTLTFLIYVGLLALGVAIGEIWVRLTRK